MTFCINCGQEIAEDAKFCAYCGKTTDNNTSRSQRRTIYDGEIHKCPNCGEVLGAFVVNCPSCGCEIRGNNTSNSAREFAIRLANASSDEQKITLIKSFPIPNSKEDILEFMVVASTNFDASANLSGNEMNKIVSDAWLSKVEQSYQKAMLLFFDDSDFSKIQNVYDKVCSKIKKSTAHAKKERIVQAALRTLGLWGGVLVFFVAFVIDISSSSANTSILHLGATVVLIIGSCMIGRKKEMIDVGIGAFACVLTIMLGLLLQEVFHGNGSLMELGGVFSLVIVIVKLFKCVGKRQ